MTASESKLVERCEQLLKEWGARRIGPIKVVDDTAFAVFEWEHEPFIVMVEPNNKVAVCRYVGNKPE